MKKWLLLGIPVLALLGAALWYFYLRAPEPPRYVTATVRRGDVVQQVNATGTVSPLALSPVGSQVSGIVWKLHADYNTQVKKGQVLVELEPALFRTAMAQASANLASARADVQRAEADLQDARAIAGRAQQLAEKRYIAQAERDTAVAKEHAAEAALVGARARVQQASAQLSRSQLDFKNSVILSPVDGVVIARNVEVGQGVVASFQAPNLFTIAEDLRKMQVLANVDEADIGALRVGQSATFTVDSYRGRRFSAKVSQVRNAAQTLQNVVTYVVVLDVDNTDLSLKPGMTANVRLEIARREGVLLVPSTSLRFKPASATATAAAGRARGEGRGREGGRGEKKPAGGTVYLLQAGAAAEPKPQPVTTGITDGESMEIVSGLEEGQTVVVDQVRRPSSAAPPAGAPRPGGGGGMRRAF